MSALTLRRIEKEEQEIISDPVPNVLIARRNTFEFHFCFYGLDHPYDGGFYHGVLNLHSNYPFEPPTIMMLTPSGRFDICKPICTSFTNYHR